MPPKTKRMIHLAKAREAKRQKMQQQANFCDITPSVTTEVTATVEEMAPGEASEQRDMSENEINECMYQHIES